MTLDEEKPKITPGQIKPGMKFNHWTVIKYDYANKHGIKYFLCKCDCGTVRSVRGTALIQGTSKACCRQCEDNIIGQQFGYWTVLKRDASRLRYYWCRCVCGTERSVFDGSLKNGTTKSCGCRGKGFKSLPQYGMSQEAKEKYEACVGKKFGKLTALFLNNAGGYFICRCDCGKEIQVAKYNLINGNTTSCGCQRAETLRKHQKEKYEKEIGHKINHLTIDGCFYKNNSFWYNCTCDCGKKCTCLATKVITGYLQSCGCLKSSAEEALEKILQKENVLYKREYKLHDCRDKNPLPFDFAIFNEIGELKGMIECNGQQHYTVGGWNTKEHLDYVQKHDKIKLRFCLQNQIPFLVIPYQYFKDIENFLKTSDFWQLITKNSND